MALRDIKNKITSVKKTAKVTKAMESVSAVKMRKAQEVALRAREYAFFAFWALDRLTAHVGKDISDFFSDKPGSKIGIVLVSPDKGLAGSINTNLFKEFERFMLERNLTKDDVVLITVGKKAHDYTKRRGYTIVKHAMQLGEANQIQFFKEISDECINGFLFGDVKEYHVVHTRFKTTTEQRPTSRQILPISKEKLQEFIHEIIPKQGKYSDKANEYSFESTSTADYKFEPNPEEVLKSLLPFLVNVSLYYSLLESLASEHSARMVAMKNATDKARDVARDLQRMFNKQRQAAITKEISEITSGMETAG